MSTSGASTVAGQNSVVSALREAVRHTAVYGLGNILAKMIGFLMLPIYTRYLAPDEYGTLEILDLSMSLFGMFLTMGMVAAMLRVYARADSELEKQKVIGTAFWFIASTGILTFTLGVPYVQTISARLLGPAVPPMYLLLSFTSFILSYITLVPYTYLRALEASQRFVLLDSTSFLSILGLNVQFIVVMRLGMLGMLLSPVIVFGVQLTVMSIWLIRKTRLRFSGTRLRQMFKFGAPLVFADLSMFALNFSDRFFLQHLRSLEVVGIYAIGYKIGYMMNYLLVQPFYLMWQSRLYAIQKRPDHRIIFRQLFTFYSLLLTYAGLGLALFGREIIRLMAGPNFTPAGTVVPVIAAAYVLYGVGYYAQLGIFLSDRTRLVGLLSAAAAILNLILNYVLVQTYGMLGAAWATLISFGAMGAASYCLSQRLYPLPLGIGRIIAAIMTAAALYLASLWIAPFGTILSILIKSGCLLVYPVLIWRLRLLSEEEAATLTSAKDRTWIGMLRLVGWEAHAD